MFISKEYFTHKLLSRGAISSHSKINERIKKIKQLAKTFKKLSIDRQNSEILGLFYYFEESAHYTEEWFSNKKQILFPRGIALHIPSSNIPLMPIYSWLPSYLVGNANYIRLSRRTDYQLLELIIKNIDIVLGEEESKNQIFYSGNIDDLFTKEISQNIDLRLIWGSEESIRNIKETFPNSSVVEISFRNRYSSSLIDSKSYMNFSDEEKNITVNSYIRDTLDFSFNACSSPHYTFWLGENETNLEAYTNFYNRIKIHLSNRSIEYGIISTNNFNKLQDTIIRTNQKINIKDNIGGLGIYFDDIQNINHINGENLSIYWLNFSTLNINQLASYFPDHIQTLTCSNNFSRNNIKDLISTLSFKSPERIVNIGDALSFKFIWDGNDLLQLLSREVYIG